MTRQWKSSFGAGIVALLAVGTFAPAQASLMGDTVHGCLTNPNFQSFFPAVCASGFSGGGQWHPSYPIGPVEQSEPVSSAIGGGTEFSDLDDFGSFSILMTADFDATSLTLSITETISDSWGQIIYAFRLSDLITDVTLMGGNSIPIAGIAFDDHQMFITTHGFGINAGQTLSATFEITATDVMADAPEPAMLGMIGLGLAGLGALRRRRS
jgi:hypothetical protein